MKAVAAKTESKRQSNETAAYRSTKPLPASGTIPDTVRSSSDAGNISLSLFIIRGSAKKSIGKVVDKKEKKYA